MPGATNGEGGRHRCSVSNLAHKDRANPYQNIGSMGEDGPGRWPPSSAMNDTLDTPSRHLSGNTISNLLDRDDTVDTRDKRQSLILFHTLHPPSRKSVLVCNTSCAAFCIQQRRMRSQQRNEGVEVDPLCLLLTSSPAVF
jgi:hypothetical protein